MQKEPFIQQDMQKTTEITVTEWSTWLYKKVYQEDNREFPSEPRRKFTKLIWPLKRSLEISPVLQFTTEKTFLSFKNISLLYDTGYVCLYMLHSSSHILGDAASTHYWWIITFYLKKKKITCRQWKLIHYAIPSNYKMTGWYQNIYFGLSILCISKVSRKKTSNIHKTQKMIQKEF